MDQRVRIFYDSRGYIFKIEDIPPEEEATASEGVVHSFTDDGVER